MGNTSAIGHQRFPAVDIRNLSHVKTREAIIDDTSVFKVNEKFHSFCGRLFFDRPDRIKITKETFKNSRFAPISRKNDLDP